MKDHPIIFSTNMIKAILDGRKTQTRRIVKAPKLHPDYGYPHWDDAWIDGDENEQYLHIPFSGDAMERTTHRAYCPYGQVGDKLWARETWRLSGGPDSNRVIYKADGETVLTYIGAKGLSTSKELEPQFGWQMIEKYGTHYHPSIHMPKWAARIWLEITNIRVERVQDIDAVEAETEGIRRPKRLCPDMHDEYILFRFQRLWDSLNAKRGYGWDNNPWVWVIEFKKVRIRKCQT